MIFTSLFFAKSETGELNDKLKKWIFHGHGCTNTEIKKEMGDILWYLAMMAECFGWSLDDIAQLNIDKLKARYPEGIDTEKSLHRAEGDI